MSSWFESTIGFVAILALLVLCGLTAIAFGG